MTSSSSRPPHVEITVVDVKGSAPRESGARMFWYPGGRTEDTIGGGNLENQALQTAAELWEDARRGSESVEYPLSAKVGQCCGGFVRLFFRKVLPSRSVLICGAGHVATALASVLSDTPFQVTVVDPRREWADSARFDGGIRVLNDEPEAVLRDEAARDEETYLLIMTHDHPTDEGLCRLALRYRFPWIGLIGSRTKWNRFQQRLSARGYGPSELARITCPIGDPALGKSPREIAISVAAQLLSIHQGTSIGSEEPAAYERAGQRAALILAGGASRRMGRWKGGLPVEGIPLVQAHASTAKSAGAVVCQTVYPDLYRDEAEKLIPSQERILNVDPDAPLFASLQLGLRKIVCDALEIDSLLVVPVDMIPLDSDWIAALWDRHESTGAWATRPLVLVSEDNPEAPRHGHPVVLSHRLFARILSEDPETARLDTLLRDLPIELKAELEVPAPEALSNLNTPEDLPPEEGEALSS